jgi:hypothetical protein
MKEFDIKKGLGKNLEGDLLGNLMKAVFGNVSKEGDMFVSSFGVLTRIEVKMLSNILLQVDTVSGTPKDDAEIMDSKRKLNDFLEQATGFNAKARMKREQDKAKKG